MAYNPFDFFRKHQKVLFAGVTVVIMFVFVLQAGVSSGADFFQSFPRWLAQWQTHGDVMAKIDGSTIKESQLRDVAAERNLANGYMNQAASKALDAAGRAAAKEVEGATDPNLGRQLGQYLQTFQQAMF